MVRLCKISIPAALIAFACAATSASPGESTESWVQWSRARARSLEAQGQYSEAIEEWTALAALEPRDVEPMSRAAVLAVEMPVLEGRDLTPESTSFQLADRFVRGGIARGGQGDPGLAYAIGRMRFAEGKWGPAWSTLGDAKQWGFDPVRVRYWHYRAAVNRGAALVDAGRAEAAVSDLEALRKAQPGHPEERLLLVNLAVARHRTQEPDVAIKLLEGVIATTPGFAGAHYMLAIVLEDQGRLADAERSFRDAMLHATASYSDRTYHNALMKLCDLEIKLGKLPEAASSADQLRSLAKDEPDALYAQGRVKQARGDFDGAVILFRRVARAMPDSLETLQNLQKALFQLGKAEESDEVRSRIDALRKKLDAELLRGSPLAPGDPKK